MKLNAFVINLGLAFVLFDQTLHGQQNVADDRQIANTRAKAEQGGADAQFTLGYYYAVGLGVAKDEVEALKWYRKAAEQNLATAQFNLGSCYDQGQGIAKNMAEAVNRKAAEQNYANAQVNLALCCIRGQGVAQDDAEGYKWLLLSSAQGFEQAKNAVTKLDVGLSGEQIEKGKQRANNWLEQHKKP